MTRVLLVRPCTGADAGLAGARDSTAATVTPLTLRVILSVAVATTGLTILLLSGVQSLLGFYLLLLAGLLLRTAEFRRWVWRGTFAWTLGWLVFAASNGQNFI